MSRACSRNLPVCFYIGRFNNLPDISSPVDFQWPPMIWNMTLSSHLICKHMLRLLRLTHLSNKPIIQRSIHRIYMQAIHWNGIFLPYHKDKICIFSKSQSTERNFGVLSIWAFQYDGCFCIVYHCITCHMFTKFLC